MQDESDNMPLNELRSSHFTLSPPILEDLTLKSIMLGDGIPVTQYAIRFEPRRATIPARVERLRTCAMTQLPLATSLDTILGH